MARVMLVGLPILRYRQPLLGLGYIGAALKRAGHEVRLHTIEPGPAGEAAFAAACAAFAPAYVGVSVLTAQFTDAVRVVTRVKAYDPSIVTVAGGAHISAIPDVTLRMVPALDFAVRGEGERSFCALIDARTRHASLESVPGLVYRDGNEIRANTPDRGEDIDELAYPWDVIDPVANTSRAIHGYTCRHRPVATVLSSRGCPYLCTFCAQHTVFGHAIRMRDPRRFVDELAYLHRRHGIREFHFADDNFTFYPEHARAVCEQILARGLRISWALVNGIRADRVDEPLLRLMKRAGCYYTAFGLESGSAETLARYKKSLDVATVHQTVRIASRLGYITQGFFLVAPPFETERDLSLTIGLIKALPLDRIAIGVPIPYPGTGLFDYYRAHGWLPAPEQIDWSTFIWGQFPYRWEHLSPETVSRAINEALRAVYTDPLRMIAYLLKLRTVEQYRITLTGFVEWMKHIVGNIRNLRGARTAD